jgi:hypothetical protein
MWFKAERSVGCSNSRWGRSRTYLEKLIAIADQTIRVDTPAMDGFDLLKKLQML